MTFFGVSIFLYAYGHYTNIFSQLKLEYNVV